MAARSTPVIDLLFGKGQPPAPTGRPSTSKELEDRIASLEQSDSSQNDLLHRHERDLSQIYVELPDKAQTIQVDAIDQRTSDTQTTTTKLDDDFDSRSQQNTAAWAQTNFAPTASRWFGQEMDQAEFDVRADVWAVGHDFNFGGRVVGLLGLDDATSSQESVTAKTVGAIAKLLASIGNDLPAITGTVAGGGVVSPSPGGSSSPKGSGTMSLQGGGSSGGGTGGLGALPGAGALENRLRYLLQVKSPERQGAFQTIQDLHLNWDGFRSSLNLVGPNRVTLQNVFDNWGFVRDRASDFHKGILSEGLSNSINAIVDKRVAKLNEALKGAGLNAVQLGAMASLTDGLPSGKKVHQRLKDVTVWYEEWWESGALSGLGMDDGVFGEAANRWWATIQNRADGAYSRFDDAADDWLAHRPDVLGEGFLSALTSHKLDLFDKVEEWWNGTAVGQALNDRFGEFAPMSDGLASIGDRFGKLKDEFDAWKTCHTNNRNQLRSLKTDMENDRDKWKSIRADWTWYEILGALLSPILGIVIAASKIPSMGDAQHMMDILDRMTDRQARRDAVMDNLMGCMELGSGNMGSIFGSAKDDLGGLRKARA